MRSCNRRTFLESITAAALVSGCSTAAASDKGIRLGVDGVGS